MDKERILDKITAENVGFDLAQEAANLYRTLKNPAVSHKKVIETAARQIRTYESEVLEDNVISFYPCFIHSFGGEIKLFSSNVPREEFLIESQIDPLERDGMVLGGFRILQEKVGRLDGQGAFLWVSPKGSAGKEGIYKDINYRYHQIYLGKIKGEKIEAFALKSDLGEAILAEWINQICDKKIVIGDKGFSAFLLNPIVVSLTPDGVLLELKQILDRGQKSKFYKDIDIDSLSKMIKDVKTKQEEDVKRISGQIERDLFYDKYPGVEEARKAIGGQLYVLYGKYADEKGEVKLKGCAGGSISINNLFGNSQSSSINNIFSTKFRFSSGLFEQENEWFKCPKCNYKADGPVGDTCPRCGLTKDEYAKESGQPVCV